MADDENIVLDALAPVFLELGKAVYICQIFESSLCFLLSLLEHEIDNGEEGVFQEAWNFHSKKPLGQLLDALRKKIEVPEDLKAYILVGIDKRNEIVHRSIANNIIRLYESTGRIEFERELVELKNEVKRRDITVNQLIDSLLKKYGLSNTSLKRDADVRWN